MMYRTKSLQFNFLMNSILTLSSIIFPLITFPYVSRILLPEGVGKVSLATSVVSYFSLIAQLGIPTYGIRVCAKVRDNKEELVSCTQELLIINIIMSVISYIGYFSMVFLIDKLANEKCLYIVMSTTILLNSIGIEWLYKGLEQYTYITIRSIAFKILALIALFLFVHQRSDYVLYGAISVLAASLSNVLNFINARKYIFQRSYRKLQFRRHLNAILIFFAMSCATTIYTHLDTIMIGFMNTDADVGYYNSAIKIKQFLVSIVTSLGAVLLPRSSYYIETNQLDNFKKVSQKALRFVFVVGIPMTIYFILFAKPCIYLLSGEAFTKSILPMQILMPTVLFIGLSNLLGMQMLVPLGKEIHILYSEVLGAVTDFIINIILIPQYSSAGAAVGTLIAEFVVLLYQYIILQDIVGKMFRGISYGKLIIAAILSAVISMSILQFEFNYFFTLCISAGLFGIIYFSILILSKEKFVLEILNEVAIKIHTKE